MSDQRTTRTVPVSAALRRPMPVPPPRLLTDVQTAGSRGHVVVGGEIDLDTAEAFESALRSALEGSDTGVDLDLSKVGFCDASGLNVLLRLRERALEDERTLALRAASPAVIRLLCVTDSLALLTGWPQGEDAQDGVNLRSELAHLRRAMETRPVIDMARGLLMATFRLSAEDAWTVLVEVSQHSNTKLHELAQVLLDAGSAEGAVDPEVQHEVSAAVIRLAAEEARPDDTEAERLPASGQCTQRQNGCPAGSA